MEKISNEDLLQIGRVVADRIIERFLEALKKELSAIPNSYETNKVFNDEALHMRELLKTKLNDVCANGLYFSVRALHCLEENDIHTLRDLVSYKRLALLRFRNFGKKSLTEVDEMLDYMGLSFEMDLKEYYTDEEISLNKKKS
ncbi:MAG: hypothetical protein K9J13_17560 [Saprospiraceae bacterium]|nr:hypothetical protein [Saprospiraceae bacterium]